MAIYKTQGIILGRHNLGEADRIIVFITPERGVARGVARGVRKIKSRMAGHLELFCQSELMLAEGKSLDVITSARLIAAGNFTADFERLRLAYLFAEMVARTSGEDEPHAGEYGVVEEAYVALSKHGASPELELWFKLQLLSCLGYRPELAACVVCGTDNPIAKYFFNYDLGGIVDAKCRTADSPPLGQDAIKLWRLLLAHGTEVLSQVAGASSVAVASLPIIDDFYRHTFGRSFRSSEVLA